MAHIPLNRAKGKDIQSAQHEARASQNTGRVSEGKNGRKMLSTQGLLPAGETTQERDPGEAGTSLYVEFTQAINAWLQ